MVFLFRADLRISGFFTYDNSTGIVALTEFNAKFSFGPITSNIQGLLGGAGVGKNGDLYNNVIEQMLNVLLNSMKFGKWFSNLSFQIINTIPKWNQ